MKVIEKIHSIITGYQKEEVKGFEAWTVTWRARYGEFSDSWNKKAKVFVDKEAAETFAKSLREAQELLQYTENIHIRIEKQE